MLVPETEVVVLIGGTEARRLVLHPGEYAIGREPGVEILVEANLVSRRHARLTLNYDHALIEDLGSSNGTFVNGRPVTDTTRLWPGQKIQVGSATITLHRQRAPLDPDVSLTPQVATVRRLLPEEVLRAEKYDIGGQIAQGGMGAILTAREAAIRREIAMKVMLGSGDEADLMRFVEEAQITGQLEHPNIVPVHELGVDANDQLFYTMKMVRGITLKKVLDLLAAGTPETVAKYPLAALLTVFQKVCDAVAFAHSKGVIHRDLKPENLMLGGYGEVLVMDWGLAKVVAPGGDRAVGTAAAEFPGARAKDAVLSVRREQGATGSTLDGTILGTPQYMAPEQARGEIETLDARADIYALGTILYHLLALRPSVAGSDAMEIVEKVARGEIEALEKLTRQRPGKTQAPGDESGKSFAASRPGVSHLPGGQIPDSLAAVVRKAMAFRPEDRYASVPALQVDIAAYQGGFATSAENASLFKQTALLIRRHRGVFTTAAAAWAVLTALAVWFVINVTHERNRAEKEKVRAEAGEQRAEHSLATANAHLLRVKVEKARDAFDSGHADEGLAWLAAVLRQDPQNRFAPSWIRSALTDRNFPLPSAPPIIVEKTIEGATGQNIASVRFSRDGRKLLIGSEQGGVGLWDAATSRQLGQPLTRFHARDAVLLPDGKGVIWLSYSGKAAFGDIESGEKLAMTPDALPPISRMALSPDSRFLAVADAQRDVRLLDSRTLQPLGEPFRVLPTLPTPIAVDAIHSMDFSRDSRWLALRAGNDAQVWDLAARKPLEPPFVNISGFPRFDVSSSRLLIPRIASERNRWRLWDAASGVKIDAQESPGQGTVYATLSPDGSRVATGSEDFRARIWDARTGAAITPFLLLDGGVLTPQFSPEGLRLLTLSRDHRCRLWDVRSGEPLSEPWHLAGAVPDLDRGARFSPDGAQVALIGRGRIVQCWNVREGRELPVTVRIDGGSSVLAFSPDGEHLLVSSGRDASGYAMVANARTGQPVLPKLVHQRPVNSAVFSPDGRLIATASKDNTTRLWDAATGKAIGDPLVHERQVIWVTFSQDGKLLATGGDDNFLRVWEVATGHLVAPPMKTATSSTIRRIAFSPDGALVAAATDYGAILFETHTGKERGFFVRNQTIPDLRFSPDGRKLAVATDRDGALVIDIGTGEPAFPPLPHGSRVITVRFTPDGARLLTAALDGSARMWDAHTGAPLSEVIQHGEPLSRAELSLDGECIATAAKKGHVRLWDARNGQPLSEPLRHLRDITSIAFSPDGRRLAVGLDPEVVSIWDVPSVPSTAPAWLPTLAEVVAGRRLSETGEIVSTEPGDFWNLRERLLSGGSADEWSRWAAWFFADRTTRTVSAWSEVTLPDEIARLVAMNSNITYELALRHDPGNFIVMAREAARIRASTGPPPNQLRDAEYLTSLSQTAVLRNEIAAQRTAGNELYLNPGLRDLPSRDPAATARELDLTFHYNMILEAATFGGEAKYQMGGLPRGLQTLDGVRFDIRGLVALSKKYPPLNRPYPVRVEQIPVGQRAQRLHFLHSSGYREKDGTKIGHYLLRYADGETRELPIVYGEDLRGHHYWNADKDDRVTHAREAWRGKSEDIYMHIYHRAYDNPRPEVEIATLDFVSAETDAAPFVVAITLE